MTDSYANLASRLWRKDASLWQTPADTFDAITSRLGWLDSIDWMLPRAGELQMWARAVAESGEYDRAIVLGMGGSSLAPAVFASLFSPPANSGYLPLAVIDTTDPAEITRIANGDLRRCLFIVSSKSGDTIETVDLADFFHAQLSEQCADPSSRFVLITDEGSKLHQLGGARFGKIFINPDDIGGRYSALSYFGLAPAALLGVDVGKLLARAQAFCETTRADDPQQNPALALGMLLGRSALAGKDKLILRVPDELAALGLWIEQLIAESTGKNGAGLVPVIAGEELDFAGGEDRITIDIEWGGNAKQRTDPASDYALSIDDPYQIGAEFFRWEIATAIAACHLRVNPFDQPDVARSKANTRAFIEGNARPAMRARQGDEYDLYFPAGGESSAQPLTESLAQFKRNLTPKTYLALLAYLPEDAQLMALLQSLRQQLATQSQIISTLGIGPRYLHSTGQLHKGGPRTGRFIQFVAEDQTEANDLRAPGRAYTFAQLYRAQADGDFAALTEANPDAAVMRVTLKADRLRALAAFAADFTGAQE